MQRPIIIGVAGGSGSGKTTVVRKLFEQFADSVALIEQDAYYKDQAHLTFEERLHTNYDHPHAFDHDLLIEHLNLLLDHQAIDKPVYDYTLHTRATETIRVDPKNVVIIDGILILEDQRLRDMMNVKVYVDTDADVRILRRVERDIKRRGRTLESVIDQYLNVVRPMHLQFVEPSKRYADLIIPEGGFNEVAIKLLVNHINTIINSGTGHML